ncbi:M20 family metallopeptidase [Parathalassolituus penaei]|uniref:M20 family metallopeptidase n=1 Tax=Parathalassolituus penaei TaxID=2997323 RepID=A0A9X3EET2_9GAMM|nr:M20 family metallopeptidase [Parathalassolituus penaei]MCY0966237.1 M20 family metallopeptidase [Parathalassolituus penaei]
MPEAISPLRHRALQQARLYLGSGALEQVLARRTRYRTVSQGAEYRDELLAYLHEEITPALLQLGFECRLLDNPKAGCPPLLIGHRCEDPALPTLLMYGHGDVMPGMDNGWDEGLSPWHLTVRDGRWYGRGSADNKGQHSINLAALEAVLRVREGRLGYNLKILFEMSEEVGSPGLEETCREHATELAADLFLASDGPRIRHDLPTLFLGSRGVMQFRLTVNPGNGARHSGNWGGILTNPATVLAHALTTLVSTNGRLLADFLRAPAIPDAIRALIRDLPVGGESHDPQLNPHWGDDGLSYAEKLYGSNTLEVVGFSAGQTDRAVGAIPARAEAICQLRFVDGTAWQAILPRLREWLDQRGFAEVQIQSEGGYPATRLDPQHPWAQFARDSVSRSLGRPVQLLPNLGGTIPNHCFADVLGLPTVWLPHSYPSCDQHAPNEHLLESIIADGLEAAAGLFWDLGDHFQQLCRGPAGSVTAEARV